MFDPPLTVLQGALLVLTALGSLGGLIFLGLAVRVLFQDRRERAELAAVADEFRPSYRLTPAQRRDAKASRNP